MPKSSRPPLTIIQSCNVGCPEPGTYRYVGGTNMGTQSGAATAAAAVAAEPSYWQLLAAQYGSTGCYQHAGSPHGPFLLSPAKAHELALHLARSTLLYCSCGEAASEPSAPLAASLRSKGVPVEDIVWHGLYGSKALCARRLALVIGLALDCESRRHELGLGGMDMCVKAPDRPLCTKVHGRLLTYMLLAAAQARAGAWQGGGTRAEGSGIRGRRCGSGRWLLGAVRRSTAEQERLSQPIDPVDKSSKS